MPSTAPATGAPTRSARALSEIGGLLAGRVPGCRGADPASVGVTGLQSTGGGAPARAPSETGPARHDTAPENRRGSGALEDEVRPRSARRHDAVGGQRVPHDVGE